MSVSLAECEAPSTYRKYQIFPTAQRAVRDHPCQLIGHSHQPPQIFLNQTQFIIGFYHRAALLCPPAGGLRTDARALIHFVHSGCRESNPVYKHPMLAYCRYTTARPARCPSFGPPGIPVPQRFALATGQVEPDLHTVSRGSFFGPVRIELTLHEPESCVLPVYYGPKKEPVLSTTTGLPRCIRNSELQLGYTTARIRHHTHI